MSIHADPGTNIVLVHGAWADGSSWSAVIERLQDVLQLIETAAQAAVSRKDVVQ